MALLRAFGDPPVFVEAVGGWPPEIVALHGWGRDGKDFVPALNGFAAAMVDLPGFGATPPPPEPWDSVAYAESLMPLLDDVGRPVVLVGHSFGGRVAVRLAARQPDLVKGLVLTGAPIAPSGAPERKPRLSYRLIRSAHRAGLVNDARLERARRRYGSRDYQAAQGLMRAVLVTILSERYEDDLMRIRCPVTLLWGEDDLEVKVDVARRACQLLPQATLVVAPGAGHDLPWCRPDVLRQAIVERLGS